jgi:PadR family transcriptional regulator PadR
MTKEKADLLQGTLDLLILKSLQLEPMHGFGISVRIRQLSNEMLTVEQGSLYPALYRLEDHGWIKAEWGVSDNNRKAKFYELTLRAANNCRSRNNSGPVCARRSTSCSATADPPHGFPAPAAAAIGHRPLPPSARTRNGGRTAASP